jgi:hypothetical protein
MRWKIKDARGRVVRQLDPVSMHVLRQHDRIDADALRSIVSTGGIRIRAVERVWMVAGVLAPLVVLALFGAEVVSGGVYDGLYAKTASLLFMCSIPWIVWLGMRRSRFGKVTTAMLGHSRCPHCGYDLAALPPDPEDGATVCPECGCAWLVPDAAQAKAARTERP